MRSGERHWPQSEKVWRQFALMDLMMARIGVDQLAVARKYGGAALANAHKTCLGCPFHRRCRGWLEEEGDVAELTGFCPNAGFFRKGRDRKA